MTESLRAYGFSMPKTPSACLRELLVQRALLVHRHADFTAFQVRDADDDELARIDVVWNAMLGTILVDHFLGSLFHTYTLSLSLKSGDLFRIGRSLAMEAYSATQLGEKHEYVDHLLTKVEDIAERTNDRYLIAFHKLVQAAVMLFRGQWIQSYQFCTSSRQTDKRPFTGRFLGAGNRKIEPSNNAILDRTPRRVFARDRSLCSSCSVSWQPLCGERGANG